MIKQISVFVENKPGQLLDVLDILGRENIDIMALSVADTNEYGIVRMVVEDTEKAKAVLNEGGFVVKSNHVVAIAIDDKPGALIKPLSVLNDNNVSIEYMYSFAEYKEGLVWIVIRTDNREIAEKVLKENEIKILEQ